MERSVETLDSNIEAMTKQLHDREADLELHVAQKCRCLKYSEHRCRGHRAVLTNIIAMIRQQIYALRQEKCKALSLEYTRGHKNEAKIQVSGVGQQPVQDGQEVQGTDCIPK